MEILGLEGTNPRPNTSMQSWDLLRVATKRQYVCLRYKVLPMCPECTLKTLERETGIEPATSSFGKRPSIDYQEIRRLWH